MLFSVVMYLNLLQKIRATFIMDLREFLILIFTLKIIFTMRL